MEFDLSTARGQTFSPPMDEHANQTVLIYNHLEMLSHFDHIPMGFMNRTNWIPQLEPLIHAPRSEWDEHQFVPQIVGNSEWVDIVVNNRDDKGHPFHLVRLYPNFPCILARLINVCLAWSQFLRAHSTRIPPPSGISHLQPLRPSSSMGRRSLSKAKFD